MAQSICNKCGSTTFITCPDCQPIARTNGIESLNLEQIQEELHSTYQQSDALTNEWQKKYPQMLPNPERIQSYFEDKETTLPYALYFVGGLALFIAMGMGFYNDSPIIAIFALLCSIAVSIWGYTLASSIKKQKLLLVGEAKTHEKKMADLQKKIAALEQKIR